MSGFQKPHACTSYCQILIEKISQPSNKTYNSYFAGSVIIENCLVCPISLTQIIILMFV